MAQDWSEFEERQRQAAKAQAKAGKGERDVSITEPTSLLSAYSGDTEFDEKDLTQLMKNSKLPTVSLYLSFTPDKLLRERKIYLTVFNSLKNQALTESEELIATLTHHERKQLDNDLENLHTYLEHYFNPENGRSVAVFKSGTKLNKILLLPFHLTDRLVIDRSAFITPLEQLLATQEKVLAVTVAKETALLERFVMGTLTEIDAISSFVPSEQVDKSIPKKAQRHRQQHLDWHFTAVAKRTEQEFRSGGYDAVVIFGSDEQIIQGFLAELPEVVSTKVIETTSLPTMTTDYEKIALIEKALERQQTKIEERALGNLGAYEAESMVVVGLPRVIEAQNKSFVRKLYISDDLASQGYICPEDNYLSLADGNCPICDKKMRMTTNIVDELVEIANAQNEDLLIVEKRKERMKDFDGIVGVTYKL